MISEEEARAAAARLKTIIDSDDINATAYGPNWRWTPEVQADCAVVVQRYIEELSRKPRIVESEKVEVVFVNELLDDLGVPSTAVGGEGDAEVKVNIYERLRMARRLFTRIP